jgi:bifunctional enzyme CysN/CysC
VQYVIRGDGRRAYAGRIASGSVRAGDEVLVLPSRVVARIKALPARGEADGRLDHAFAPMSTALELDDHVDVSRGDMLSSPVEPPCAARRIRARVIWMSEKPFLRQTAYLIKHTTQLVCAEAVEFVSRLDVTNLEERSAEQLCMNEIGTVVLETHRPIFCDPYAQNRVTGAFILIDPATNLTAGAGMIEEAQEGGEPRSLTATATRRGLTVWFTGLSSAGKSTLSQALQQRLSAGGQRVESLDGDAVRKNLCKDLSFSKQDRDENIRRIGFVADLLTRNGVIVLVSVISPYRKVREEVRRTIGDFVEVFVNAPLAVCEGRDVKGLYRKARAGQLPGFTGIDDPYEAPENPEIECRTDIETLEQCVDKILRHLEARLA